MKHVTAIGSGTAAAGRLGRPWGLLLALALVPCCGCTPAPQTPGATTADEAQATPGAENETWHVIYIKGAKAGYQRTETKPVMRDGRQLLQVEVLQHMVVLRDGEPTEMEVRATSIETPDGGLVEFDVESSRGPEPTRVSGRVVGDSLEIERSTKGRKEPGSMPWSAADGGFYAGEQSLARNPMKPGEERTIRALVPELYVLGTNRLVAREYESVQLLTGTSDLLRIDTVLAFPKELRAPPWEGSVWTDRSGEVIKSWMSAMNVETYRTTRAEALKEIEPGEFDLVRDLKVPVARPLPSPHATKRVRYRVTVEDRDPLGVFVSGPSQKVQSIDPHTAEVTVYALRPGSEAGNADAADDPPTADDLDPNNMIQSDYPAIAAKARQVAGDERDPWAACVALERCAADTITESDYSQAFATAAEVIESGKGDCTEHAVLLAALCRARQIPARLAIGLVYIDRAFYYHMWTEVHVDGRWIALDATRAQGGTGAAHLKMAHSNFKKASALSAFLPVMQVIGKLRIEILEVE
ncbi:MAG TPA: transglutaminase-like domain-containing protein [Thermoguttaceae bacterium]|nr:transglutaminase-like domain-containing protein [Thermoguttaceae bacterium]